MLRWLYIRLLWMHPPRFRSRFCDEMLADFDESTRRAPLLLDAVVSLARQWLLRPAFDTPPAVDGAAPMFQLIEAPPLSRAVLIRGAVLSMLMFTGLAFVIGHAGSPGRLTFGVHRWRAGLIPIDRSSLQESGVTTAVCLGDGFDAEDLLFWERYFKGTLILRALDANGDAALDIFEIAAAPRVLSTLDRNSDGRLTAEECGYLGASPDPQLGRRQKLAFMRVHPALASLDADRSGEISSAEIAASAIALRTLDRNGDGALAPFEVMSEPAEIQASAFLALLDVNDDGRISPEEDRGGPVHDTLRRADRDGDGTVTREELVRELRWRSSLANLLRDASR